MRIEISHEVYPEPVEGLEMTSESSRGIEDEETFCNLAPDVANNFTRRM
jgi:hypothetical protein